MPGGGAASSAKVTSRLPSASISSMRPAVPSRSPISMFGSTLSLKYRALCSGCAWNPSHNSPASWHMRRFTPATKIGMR